MTRRVRRRSLGWSLIEISVVLAVIAVLLATGLSAKDLLNSARTLRLTTTFVEPWQGAFRQYQRSTGRVPGDDPSAPTGLVKQAVGVPLCNEHTGGTVTHELSNEFLATGVPLPDIHHRPQRPDVLVYTDGEGSSHSTNLCFITLAKSETGASVGSFVAVPKAALLLRSLHWSAALAIDRAIDSTPSPRFGRVRSTALAANLAQPTAGSDCWWGIGCIGGAGVDGLVDVAVFLD